MSTALRRTLGLLVLPTAALALPGPASAAITPSQPVAGAPVTSSQGIIMRDGGVCDPIRHMGC